MKDDIGAAMACLGALLVLIAISAGTQDVAGRTYWPIPLDSAAIGHFRKHTHVAVTGKVPPNYPVTETDGDKHIKLVSPTGKFIVAECIPKLPCTGIKAGMTITVYGISRYDPEHGWYEVHPVEEWR